MSIAVQSGIQLNWTGETKLRLANGKKFGAQKLNCHRFATLTAQKLPITEVKLIKSQAGSVQNQ